MLTYSVGTGEEAGQIRQQWNEHGGTGKTTGRAVRTGQRASRLESAASVTLLREISILSAAREGH